MDRTGATADEADAVLAAIEDHAERNTIEIGSISRYIAGFDDSDLRRHLKKIRAQRASESRTEANEAAGPDARCREHHEPMPCAVCGTSSKPVLVGLLKKYGRARRPDIAQRLDELAVAP